MNEKLDGTDPVGEEAAVSPPTGHGSEQTGTVESGDRSAAGAGMPGMPDNEAEAGADRPGVVIRDRRKVRDPAESTDTAKVATEPKAAGEAADEVKPGVAAGEVKPEEVKAGEFFKPAEPVTEPEPATKAEDAGTPLGAELEALRRSTDELTRDLQRMTAEYANYRKRVDRDRGLASDQATGTVLIALLPVLDDLDRAREHGDLVGPFGAVAEQLVNALTKFGLTPFGEKGDIFDPTRHEAVTHQTSPEVSEPTCVGILRRGYLLGERLLRPALVAVADPE